MSFRSFLRRVAPLVAAFGFFSSAGAAQAQFDECVDPSDVPSAWFGTIVEQSSFLFGDLSEKVCQKITNQGVSTCKSQVKAAAKCFTRSGQANYEISLKQCKQLEDSGERDACKSNVKAIKEDLDGDIDADKDDGLSLCEGEFADDLSSACDLGIKL